MKKGIRIFSVLLMHPALGLCMFSILGLWGDDPLKVGIFSHFKWQFALASALLMLLFWTAQRRFWMIFSAILLSLNLMAILPLYLPPSHLDNQGEDLTLITFNILRRNTSYEELTHYIDSVNPDLVILHECTPTWHRKLRHLWKKYPHRRPLVKYGYFGQMIASKYPIIESHHHWFSRVDVPSIEARIQVGTDTLTVWAFHPPSPPDRQDIIWRNQMLDSLVLKVRQAPYPVVIAGDMNITPYHPRYKTFLEETGLKDSRQGFGMHNTWPADLKGLGIPLDHVMLSPEIQVMDRRKGPSLGSDHLPIEIQFRLP